MVHVSRIAGLAVAVSMVPWMTYGQHLSSARGIGLGGFTSLSTGNASLDWNPAGLVFVQDWEFDASNFVGLAQTTTGFTLHSTALSKRFLNDHAVALRYSPGKITEFVVPTTFRFSDSNVVVQTAFDQEIRYQEPYALGYAYRINDDVAAGVAVRFADQNVKDTKYFLDTNSTIRSRTADYQATTLLLDLGLLWKHDDEWSLGIAFKNLLKLAESELPDDVAQYRLDLPGVLRVGVGYQGVRDLIAGFDADTERKFRLGFEWMAYSAGRKSGLNRIGVRASAYGDVRAATPVEALAVGLGGGYEFLEVNLSYLKFLSETNRKGRVDLSSFNIADVQDVEYNPFTSDRVSLSVQFYIGRTENPAVRIEGVDISAEIYPGSASVYAYTPLGTVFVRNVTDSPVQARARFFVDRVMDAPTESKGVTVDPGERAAIPLYAIFNEALSATPRSSIREGNVYVTTRTGEDYDDRYQTQVVVRGRNDWNGDVKQLRYFLTPDEPEILQFTRSVLSSNKTRVDSADAPARTFVRAQILFDEFARWLVYVNDPKGSQDFVQYPAETLRLRGGDCDDMTVCYATILASVGISVAFVDVTPAENPSEAHIYLIFDTGLEARNASVLSENPKRFVLRKNPKGKETVWIPVETTAIMKGFEEAWGVGAKEYFEDVEMNSGLVRGWVRIIDVQFF